MKLHVLQGKAFLSDEKITLACSGIQGGKSTVGALWFLRQIHKNSGKDNNFIIGCPTYKILNQSTLPTFLKYASQFGTYHKVDQEFRLHSGGTVFIRTSTDPESVEGISNVRAIWLDEAGKCKYRFWINLEGRAARTNAPILCTTTPYAMNWVYRDLIKPHKRGERRDISYFQWTSKDNPSFPVEEYERQKKILDAISFARKYGGEHQRKIGLVFPLDDGQIISQCEIPSGSKFYAGLDWGFTNPMALIIRAITPDGRDIQISEFYESGVYPDDVAHLLKQKVDVHHIKYIIADPEDPGKIAQMQKYGLPVIAADNDKLAGIDAHNRIIRSGKYYIFSNCKNTIDEYETYSYKDPGDEDEDKDSKEEPLSKNNHAMDANRYLSLWLLKNSLHQFERPRVTGVESSRPMTSPLIHKAPWLRKEKQNKGPEWY